MQIHYILTESIYDGCDQECEVIGLYKDREKANERFIQEVKNAKTEWPESQFVQEETEDSFYAYRDGESTQFHCNIQLQSKELED